MIKSINFALIGELDIIYMIITLVAQNHQMDVKLLLNTKDILQRHYGSIWFSENTKERKKKCRGKQFSLVWMTWKIRWKKNIKESIKENIVIFSLLFSLKNNEENKRKREGQRRGKFYQALVHRDFTSHFLFIGGYEFSPSSTLSTATTITPTTFQDKKPTLFKHQSSHG